MQRDAFWLAKSVLQYQETTPYPDDNIAEHSRIGISQNIVADFNYLVKFAKVFDAFVIIMTSEGVSS